MYRVLQCLLQQGALTGALLGTPERGVPEVFWRKNTCVMGGEEGEGSSRKGQHV